jgi:hypothetical protein
MPREEKDETMDSKKLELASSLRIRASAFAFMEFSQAAIFVSSRVYLQLTQPLR